MKKTGLWTVATVVFLFILSIMGAIIGIELLTILGVTPNTFIIGALVAMILARVPVKIFSFSLHCGAKPCSNSNIFCHIWSG